MLLLISSHSKTVSESANPAETARSLKVVDATTNVFRLPTVIYASRTHSQLSQVIKELKSTVFRHKTRVCVLGVCVFYAVIALAVIAIPMVDS